MKYKVGDIIKMKDGCIGKIVSINKDECVIEYVNKEIVTIKWR